MARLGKFGRKDKAPKETAPKEKAAKEKATKSKSPRETAGRGKQASAKGRPAGTDENSLEIAPPPGRGGELTADASMILEEAAPVAADPAGTGDPGQAQAAGAAPQGPLFYSQPAPLSRQRFGQFRIRSPIRFGFAAGATVIPLTVREFPVACRHYPIVFAEEAPAALAVVGLGGLGGRSGEGGNAFVDAEGAWRAGCYVPAWVRRYPFIALDAGDGQFALCIDQAAECLSETEGEPLFEGEEMTEVTKRALDFCQAYRQQEEVSRQFVTALEQAGLLNAQSMKIERPGAKPLTVQGFRSVDRQKLAEMEDARWLEFRRLGLVLPIDAHLISLGSWQAFAAS